MYFENPFLREYTFNIVLSSWKTMTFSNFQEKKIIEALSEPLMLAKNFNIQHQKHQP